MVQAEGGRKGGKKKTEKHENYPIKCINSWSLLLVTFKYPTYPWPKEIVSSSSEWCPSPWRKKHRTVNHKLAPVFFIKKQKQNTIVKILTWRYLRKQKCLLTCHQKLKQIYFYMSWNKTRGRLMKKNSSAWLKDPFSVCMWTHFSNRW